MADVADRYRPDTLSGFLTVIAHAHRAGGHTFDRTNFKVILEGIHRSTYGSLSRQKKGITINDLCSLVASLPDTWMGARDRVILTLGFAAALRPGELVGLAIGRAATNRTGSVEITQEGLRLTLSRTQVDVPPIVKAVPRGGSPCPVEALERWLALADVTRRIGSKWRGLPDRCVTHGLRKAAARRLADAGCTVHQIMAITGHQSLKEVERYAKAAEQRQSASVAIEKLEAHTVNKLAQP